MGVLVPMHPDGVHILLTLSPLTQAAQWRRFPDEYFHIIMNYFQACFTWQIFLALYKESIRALT